MPSLNLAVALNVRLPMDLRDQLEELSDSTGKTKSFLAAEAINNYLMIQAWQVKATKKALKKANSKNACFVDHQKVSDWLQSWGSKNEEDMPR